MLATLLICLIMASLWCYLVAHSAVIMCGAAATGHLLVCRYVGVIVKLFMLYFLVIVAAPAATMKDRTHFSVVSISLL